MLGFRYNCCDVRNSSGDLPVAPTARMQSPEQEFRDRNQLGPFWPVAQGNPAPLFCVYSWICGRSGSGLKTAYCNRRGLLVFLLYSSYCQGLELIRGANR